MTETMTRKMIRGWLVAVLATVLVGTSVWALVAERGALVQMSARFNDMTRQKELSDDQSARLRGELEAKQKEFIILSTQNFQQQFLDMQAAFKQAQDQMSLLIREKAAMENVNAMLDSRLKNTTGELTRTLEDLKQARQTLGGIEAQYRNKIEEINSVAKSKDEMLVKLQERVKEGQMNLELSRQNQTRIADLERNQTILSQTLSEKELALKEKTALVETYKKDLLQTTDKLMEAQKNSRNPKEVQMRVEDLEREKASLERQVSQMSAKLFDQQETISALQRETPKDSLAQVESELAASRAEVLRLKEEITALKTASKKAAAPLSGLSASQKELEVKIRALEEENGQLVSDLAALRAQGSASGVGTDDIFQDANFRIMTETLVRKEEQIKQMQTEMMVLKQQLSEATDPKKERRLAELDVVVASLTKQLGEYAATIEKKDAQLQAADIQIAQLTQDVQAHQEASSALHRELGDVRNRQEKTIQTLSQIMSLNTRDGQAVALPASANSADSVTGSDRRTRGSGSVRSKATDAAVTHKAADEGSQKRAEVLRKQVEVLLDTGKQETHL